MCGDEAAAARHCLDVKYPVSFKMGNHLFYPLNYFYRLQVENGIVKDWNDMEHLWDYTFYEKLKVELP